MHSSPNGYWRLERSDLCMPVRIDPEGRKGPTKRGARSTRWRRTSRGQYVPSTVSDEDVEQRIVEAAAVVPEGGAVTGWAALRWQGGVWFDGLTRGGRARLPVTVVAPSKQIRAQAGIEVSEEFIRPGEIIRVDGLPITVPARSVCYLMRYASSLRDAVVALDMAAYDDLVSITEAASYATTLKIWTGIPQCREAIGLAHENSWSPQEVGAGFVWVVVAGLPPPLRNRPVFDLHGRHIGTPDLLDEEAGLVGEYDGRLHLAGQQRRRDRDREARYREVGLEVVVLLDTDAASPDRTAALILEARSRARFEPASERRWTTEPPPWWIPTFTVEQRRALDPDLRNRWLGYRRQAG
ncbi:hypothetical protein [Nocardioides taihuensis]|uniref:DUF559 domain-containing protein n=1 Tax=Nocardioides taihuensis TaxID=1835606 RepID=A0ABW0BJK9_9ACTN